MAQHPVTNPPTGAAAGGGRIRAALKCAFPYTIPIFAGFWFLGMTYGIYMNVSGFSFWYPLLMSLTIFGGSLEFVAVSMLLAPYAPVQCFLMALMIQARHLFYGIAMLDKFKGLGWKKPYLIYGMCDETFSINCSAEIPEGIDRGGSISSSRCSTNFTGWPAPHWAACWAASSISIPRGWIL